MTWMANEDRDPEHTNCRLEKYMDGEHGPHYWDADCQIKFVPRAYLDSTEKRPLLSGLRNRFGRR